MDLRPVRLALDLAESGEQLLLPAAHGGRLLGFGVVVVEQVQDTVHDEQRDLVVGGNPALERLATGDGRARR